MSKKKPRKRTEIKGHYMQVRQRSTKKGRKGTIMGKWKPKKEETPLEKTERKARELVFGKTKKKREKSRK